METSIKEAAEKMYPLDNPRKNMFHDNPAQTSKQNAFIEGAKWQAQQEKQFTGRTDINGKKVYGGDTIKYQHSIQSKEYIGQVIYNPEFASYWLKTGEDSGFALLGQQQIIEVINGN